MTTTLNTIGFIGAGNMASAMISGLIQSGFPSSQLWASDPNLMALDFLKSTYLLQNTTQKNNDLFVNQVNVLILAVKPDILKSILIDLRSLIQEKNPLIISIAAGISTDAIYHWLDTTPDNLSVVRAMPNTPALINQAVTGVFSPTVLSPNHLKITETILSAIGSYIWLEKEAWLNIVTGLSGSGPAFIFYILEAMISQATKMGLPEPIAKELALKTCLGSANLALTSDKTLTILRQQVTSKGGTTFAGLQQADAVGLAQAVQSMIASAVNRAQEICQETY